MSRKLSNAQIGQYGEDIAVLYLQKNGYAIADRNKAYKVSELDIVAIKGKIVYLVEVKTSVGRSQLQRPEERVSYSKRQKLRKAAGLYIGHYPTYDVSFMIIAVRLQLDPKKAWIKVMDDIPLI